MTYTTARRTTIVEGLELDYERVHATVPVPVADALRKSGVVDWRIWRDGRLLFHVVDTTHGYEAMVTAITALKPIDDEWDALIDSLLDSSPGSDVIVHQVWSLAEQTVDAEVV